MRNILGTSLVASIFSLVLLTVITQPDLQQSVLFNTKHGSFQKNHCLLQLSCSHSFHSSSLWSFSVPYSSLPSSTTHSFNYEITFFSSQSQAQYATLTTSSARTLHVSKQEETTKSATPQKLNLNSRLSYNTTSSLLKPTTFWSCVSYKIQFVLFGVFLNLQYDWSVIY